MKDAWQVDDVRMKDWRRALFISAFLISLYLPLEFHYERAWLAVSLRLAWILCLLVAALLVRPRTKRLVQPMAHLAGLASGVFSSAIIGLTGGSHGPRFGFLLAYPLAVLIMAPEMPFTAAYMAMGTLVGGLFILTHEGRDAWFIGEWTFLSLCAATLTALGVRSVRRIWRSELEAHRARANALAKLAEAQHLALVGRLAVDVAHEINNPLAVVKANLEWVREQPGTATLADDAVEVLADTSACTDRIARIVADMASLARTENETLEPCEISHSLGVALPQAPTFARRGSVAIEALPAVWAVGRRLQLGLGALLEGAGVVAEQLASSGRPGPSLFGRLASDDVVLEISSGWAAGEGLSHSRDGRSDGLAVAVAREHLRHCGAGVVVERSARGAERYLVRLRLATRPQPEPDDLP